MKNNLIILLHGVGSRGDDLAPLVKIWQPMFPKCYFALPNAPENFNFGPGYQWINITDITEKNWLKNVQTARLALDNTMIELMTAHGLKNKPEQVILVGFSQGAMMALDVVASGRWPVAAVVAFSGKLASPGKLTPKAMTPVLLLHGKQDKVISAIESEHAARQLNTSGAQATVQLLPGLGHTISYSGISIAGHFIKNVINNPRNISNNFISLER